VRIIHRSSYFLYVLYQIEQSSKTVK